ncbi:MAG: hypothetical protein ACKV2Q_24015 [Planctomycetaceae bacterium]
MPVTSSTSDLLHALNEEAQNLFILLKTIDSFCGTSGKVKLINSIAPEFFVVVRDALVDCVILSVSKLTDNQPRHDRSVTLERLIDAAFQRPSSAEEVEVRKNIDELKHVCQPLRKRRNKGVAHNDEGYATGVKSLPAISARQFAKAASLVQTIVNAIQQQLGEQPTEFDDNARRIKTGGNLLLQKLVWARRWEQQEEAKYTDSRLHVSDAEIENTDWSADPPIQNSSPTSTS